MCYILADYGVLCYKDFVMFTIEGNSMCPFENNLADLFGKTYTIPV